MRPKRDDEGNIILKKGKPQMVCVKKESEQIPLLYPGGISAFYENEVKPYDEEAEFGEPIIGYELSFTKYFYKPVQLRTLDEIMADVNILESETDGLWTEILK
jgi:type I restriction enzyme M protein